MIDSHCHLNLDQFREDCDDVVVRAVSDGVSALVNIGFDRESVRQTIDLLERFPFFYGVVGVHPHDAESCDDELFEYVKGHLEHPRVVAVGEIGLDFYRDLSPRDVQRDVFKRMLRLSQDRDLPIVIHCRDAFEDVIDTLKGEASSYRGIFHAFAGDEAQARRVLDLGFHIGIGGVLTYRNSDLAKTVRSIPLDRIVLETDSPYLTPHPYRGKRNEPSYVAHVARAVASVKKVSQTEVDQVTTDNLFTALGIGEEIRPRGVYTVGHTVYIQTTMGGPEALEGFEASGAGDDVDEAIICGFGEPLDDLDRVMKAAQWAADKGLRVRVNTTGLGNVVAGRDVTKELAEYVDEIVVPFFGTTAEEHERMALAGMNEEMFSAMGDFIRRSARAGMDAVCEFIAAPKFEAEPCREFARSLGAQYDIRMYRS